MKTFLFISVMFALLDVAPMSSCSCSNDDYERPRHQPSDTVSSHRAADRTAIVMQTDRSL